MEATPRSGRADTAVGEVARQHEKGRVRGVFASAGLAVTQSDEGRRWSTVVTHVPTRLLKTTNYTRTAWLMDWMRFWGVITACVDSIGARSLRAELHDGCNDLDLVYCVRNRGHSPRPIPATAALLHFDLSPNKPAAKRLAATVLDSRITTHLSDAAH